MAEIIEMSSADVEELVYNEGNDIFQFVEGEIDRDNTYKDFAPAEWIFKRLSDNTFWCATGSMHVGHYSDGDNMYDANLTRVEQAEEVIVHKFWKAV